MDRVAYFSEPITQLIMYAYGQHQGEKYKEKGWSLQTCLHIEPCLVCDFCIPPASLADIYACPRAI